MGRKIFLVLFIYLASLSQVRPNPLTKEITADQSPQLKFRAILDQLQRTDVLGEAITFIFSNFEEIQANLRGLLQSENVPDVSQVVDIFNFGLDEPLLVIDTNYVRVDPDAFERLLSVKVRFAVESLFSKDFVRQLFVNVVLQKEVQSTMEEVRPKIENRKVSLDEISARIASDQTNIATRTDLITALQTAVCETLVGNLYSQINDTVTSVTDFLDSITVNSSDNGLSSIVANLVSFGIDLAKQAVALLWELAESIQSSICSSLLSSRKRRDLTSYQDTIDRSKRDTSLAETESQLVGVRSLTIITTVLWSILSPLLSYALASLADKLMLLVINFLISTVREWLSTLIDSLF